MSRRMWEVEYAGSPKTLWSEVMPTQIQLSMAAKLGVEASPYDTFAVVAASILESVGDAIGCPPRDVSDRQYELAEELGIDVSDCKSSWVAFVRIREAIQLVNLAAVRRMDLKPGDRVVQTVATRQPVSSVWTTALSRTDSRSLWYASPTAPLARRRASCVIALWLNSTPVSAPSRTGPEGITG